MKVTFATAYTDRSGKDHKPDSTADLPDGEARGLLQYGLARSAKEQPPAIPVVDATPAPATPKKEG